MKWVAALWLFVWFPIYWKHWGWASFLQLCDISVILTVVGLWARSSLLLSSQAVASIVINALWTLNVVWRLLFGVFLIGGTEYMLDARFPLWLRLLSLYHVVVPVIVVWALRQTGYDPRGWWLQVGISVAVLIASRYVSPALNLNFALTDPVLHVSFRPAALHLAIILFFLIAVIYWPTHQVLARTLPPAHRTH
jgi:hypothetical protein